ncbi:MAG: PhzF family phenazine biosynthesis isomerase, partial [Phycisphaerae bacterium]|nr:PhzF family phenazine biosynthesis isomerase [Phycisphaerae bacterium]
MSAPRRFLFVCVENANRSQMAEAFASRLGGDAVVAFSAGSRPSGRINPAAIASMAEIGCDLTRQASTGLDALPAETFDVVVTMGCGDACPDVPARHREDWSIPDPRDLPPDRFRVVRDRIESEVRALLRRAGVPVGPPVRRVPYTVVHSFTSTLFAGNPAGVCRLVEWLPDDLLQAIATENNLSETAFLVGGDGRYDLRWFTPAVEVDLCGHATLASAWVLLHGPDRNRAVVSFDTASGRLEVERRGDELAMDFPARPAEACETPPALIEGLRATPTAVLRARDYLAVFDRPEQVRDLDPAFDRLARLGGTGVIATAPGPFGPSGDDVDFVSRFFAPAAGIDEDPVTGSAHCTLIPY